MMRLEERAEVFQRVEPLGEFAVKAFGLNVDIVKAVFLAQLQVFQHGMILTKTVATLIESDFHSMNSL